MEFNIENIEDRAERITDASSSEENLFRNRKRHINRIFIASLWAMFAVVAAVLIIRAIHFIIPDSWCWLDAEKLQNIDKFLFSGAFGGILAKYANYIIKPENQ